MRAWNARTVVLARFAKFVWTADETFEARLELAHYGAFDLPAGLVQWSLRSRSGGEIAGEHAASAVPTGAVVCAGRAHRVARPLS